MPRVPAIPGLTDFVQIGQGGNGVVYRARQDALSRVVAVKLLGARLDESAAERFAREGQALGIVSGHPNIVPVYAADMTTDGEPYLVMLLCENGSLADRVGRHGPMSVPEVLDLGVRMSGALQTAHDAGLLHRDIKPGNILFDSYHVPRLADFGQARLADANLTKTGDVVATPGFAAPEILTGERATVRSDVYSLATTLTAALLGYGPFSRADDENVAAVLLRVLQEPPPDLRQHGVPPQLAEVLERAMDKTAGRRPMSAGEFGRQLQGVQGALGLPQTPMIIATDAAERSPMGPVTGAALATGPVGGDRTRQIGPPMPGATAVLGQPAPRARSTARPRRWIALAVALLLAAALALVAFWMTGGSVDPSNPPNASDLIVGSEGYGPGKWETTDDLSFMSNIIGTFPTSQEEASSSSPSSMISCLELDPQHDVVSSKLSGQYVDSDATKESGDEWKSYRYARSVAMVISSESLAKRYVTAFASPGFDTCLDKLAGLGTSIGAESSSYSSSAKISVPTYTPDVPDGVTYQARQIAVPLSQLTDGKQDSSGKNVGYRYISIIAMQSGTSVEWIIQQSSAKDLPDKMADAALDSFIKVATK